MVNYLVSVNYKRVFLFKGLTLFCSCFTISTTLANKNFLKKSLTVLFFFLITVPALLYKEDMFLFPAIQMAKNFDKPGCNTRQARNRAFDFTVLYASSADLNARWKFNQDPHLEKNKKKNTIPVTSMPEHVHNLIILTSGLA